MARLPDVHDRGVGRSHEAVDAGTQLIVTRQLPSSGLKHIDGVL